MQPRCSRDTAEIQRADPLHAIRRLRYVDAPPRVTATCHRHVSQVNRKGKHTEELGKLKSAMAKRLETLEETLLLAAA